jgi:hypothetical protein
MTSNIKRSLFKSFLNTGSLVSPVWSLISSGVTSGKIAYNPKTTKETYITQDTGSTFVEAYAAKFPVEAMAVNGDAIFEYLDAKRKTRAVLSDAETEMLNVWLYKGAADGIYLAEKRSVSFQFDKLGREGGKSAKLGYTLNSIGDSVLGTFDPVGLAFTATDLTALLESLVIGSGPLTLIPAFKDRRIWYTAATSNATDTITAVAEDGDAVIAIDVDGVTVVNEEAATWSEGVNLVTITSTVDADVATYYIFVTYTPGA